MHYRHTFYSMLRSYSRKRCYCKDKTRRFSGLLMIFLFKGVLSGGNSCVMSSWLDSPSDLFAPLISCRCFPSLEFCFFLFCCSTSDVSASSKSSPPKVFLQKVVLKICSKFTGEHPCRSVISITLLL